jgi:hypothetical protein
VIASHRSITGNGPNIEDDGPPVLDLRCDLLDGTHPRLCALDVAYLVLIGGRALNVYEIDDVGRLKVGWCFLPLGQLVAGDVMLAQKIALETDEHSALKVAHRFAPRGAFGPPTGQPSRFLTQHGTLVSGFVGC